MRFSTSVVLAVAAASSVPAFAVPFEHEARRFRSSHLEHINDAVDLVDGITSVAANAAA